MISRTCFYGSRRLFARRGAQLQGTSLYHPVDGAQRSSSSMLQLQTTSQKRYFSNSYDSDSDSDDDDNEQKRPVRALVLGSSGALGSYLCKHFSTQMHMQVMGADVMELPRELTGEWQLDAFCALSKDATLPEMTTQLTEAVYDFLQPDDSKKKKNKRFPGLDCLVVAAGGFQMDPPALKPEAPGAPLTREQYRQQALDAALNAQLMLQQNTYPVLAATSIARHFMNYNGGVMVVMGAASVLGSTPGMLHYGASKAAAHHLVQSLGSCTGLNSTETHSIRQQARRLRQHLPALDHLSVVGFLPAALDTPANRQAMPDDDRSKWTSIPNLAQEICKLMSTPALRPHSGSLIKIYNRKAKDENDPSINNEHDVDDGDGAFLELVR